MRTTIRMAAVAALTASIGVTLSATSATAEQVGTDDVKLTTGVDPRDVQLAYDPVSDRHLVVWDEGSGAPETIRGQIVDNAGGLVTGPFTIGQSPVGGFVGEPAVTWNSGTNQWMVAFASDDTLVGEREIYVNTVSAAGSPGTAFRVSDMGDDTVAFDAQQPDIVYNASSAETLVVWRGDDTAPGDGEDEIWGQRLSGTAEVGTNDFRISTLGADGNTLTDARAPQVAWSSGTNTYGVVFEQQDSLVPVAIWTQLLSSSGAAAGAAAQLATGSAGVSETARATIAADDIGTGFLAAWEVFTVATVTGSIAGRTISAGPSLGPVLTLSTAGVDSQAPDLGYNTTVDRYGLVFHADASAGAGTEYEIYGSLLTTSGAVAEPLERLSTMGTDGVASTVTVNAAVAQAAGGRLLSVWQSDDTTPGDTEVYGQYFQVNVPPTVTINQAVGQADPTNGSPVSFTVVFSEPVLGFTNADVSTAGSTATIGVISVSGTGPTYTVSVAASGNGTVTASILANSVTDVGGLQNSASTSTDNTVTIDTTPPTVTVNQAVGQLDPTNSSQIFFDIVSSEPLVGLTFDDFAVTNASGSNLLTLATPGTYRLQVVAIGQGPVTASLAAGKATDAAGNFNLASTSTDNSVTYDSIAPTVTIDQAGGQADPTNSGPIDFTVVFSEVVAGFTADDVVLSGSGAPGPLSATVTGAGPTYGVSVSGMTGDGTVIATVTASAATDAAGNPSVVSTSTDNTVLYDAAVPTVTVSPISADPTNADPVQFAVNFSEPVTGFGDALGDVSFTGSTAGGTLAATVAGGPQNYTVSVTGMTSSGEVAVSVTASAANDGAANANTASNTAAVTWDNVAPTVTVNQASGQADPTNAGPILFTVVASEPLTGLAAGDFSVSNGTAGSVTATAVSGVYELRVTPAGPGAVTASLPADAATDAAGNGNLASTATDNSVTYDPTAPTVTIDQAAGQADPTNVASVAFDVVFSEAVTGFGDAAGDINLSASTGVGSGVTASVSGSGASYVVTVTGMSGDGTVIASIVAGAATDTAGNANGASTSSDNTVDYDDVEPTVTVEQAAGQANDVNAGPIQFTVTFSEAVTGFDASDVVLGGTAGPVTVTVSGAGPVFTLSVNGMTTNGTVTASVAAGAVFDLVGNASLASTSVDNSVNYTPGDPNPGVNDAPVITAPVTANAELGLAVVLSGGNAVSVADVDAFADPIRVTLTATDGTVAAPATAGVTVTGSGTSSLTLVGPQSAVNTVIAAASVTFTEVGSRTLVVGADDLGHSPAPALTASTTVTFTVVDTTPPVITVPGASVLANNEPGKAGAVVTFTVIVTDRGSAPTGNPGLTDAVAPTFTCSPSSGSFFPIGTTAVTCTAQDSVGNTSTASFSVIVSDVEKPTITPPATQRATLPRGATTMAIAYPAPTVADNSGQVSVSCLPASGSAFAAGTTTVTCTATDPSGNSASASFSVVVTSGSLPPTGGGNTFVPAAFALLLSGALLALATHRRRRLIA